MARSKYHAVPTVIDNIRFASKAEARRYQQLRLLEKAGEIKGLEVQPKFKLLVPECGSGFDVQVGHYVADFRYRQGPKGVLVIEDVKSKPTKTAIYRLKKKMVEATHGIQITEVA